MKEPTTDRNNEDPLVPTRIEQGTEPENISFEKNLSREQAKERLDLYSKGDREQYVSLQKIKQRYEKQIKATEAARAQSDVYYAQGVSMGLPHTQFRTLQQEREQIDQSFRDQIVREGKAEYRRHRPLTKLFEKENRPLSPADAHSKTRHLQGLSKYFRNQVSVPQHGREASRNQPNRGMNKER